MLYVKYGENRLMASEEMLFENVGDGRRMPAYTISSPMGLQLMWAKNQTPRKTAVIILQF